MIQFLLLRHAPTPWNADKRIQGRSDIALSPEGLAEATSWCLPADAAAWPCLSSPLLRTTQTAEAMGLSPVPAAAFIEMDWGGYEGRRLSELRQEFGAALAAEEAKGLDFRPPGGESPRAVGRRALAGLAGLSANSIIVTHKGVLRPLFALATGWNMRDDPTIKIRDRCYHRFALDDGRLTLIEPNLALRRCYGKPSGGETIPDRPDKEDLP